jgi:hypothetical protein
VEVVVKAITLQLREVPIPVAVAAAAAAFAEQAEPVQVARVL